MSFYRAPSWLAAAALIAVVAAPRAWHHFNEPRLLRPGDRLTPITVSELTGRPAVLAPSGRAEVINIFATWCTPCREEMPGFAAAAQQLRARGIAVIGIDQAEDGPQVTRFAREFGIKFPLYIDSSGITHAVLGARLIPTTIFVGTDGRIKWIHPGPMSQHDILSVSSQDKEEG